MSKALIIRHGAIGDTIQTTSLIPYIKNEYDELHWICSKLCIPIIRNDPRINRIIEYPTEAISITELEEYYKHLSYDYDKTFVLSGSIEGKYLFAYPQDEYYWPISKRREHCDVVYIKEIIKGSGYAPIGNDLGKLYFDPEVLAIAKNVRMKYKNKFMILWALSGSSMHKAYLHLASVSERVFEKIPNSILFLMGSKDEAIQLSWAHPNVVNFGLNGYPLQVSLALTRFADLVIGPETGLLNAAGCFDTPKIVMLTHSSRKNLCSEWKNDYSLQAKSWCSPCHLLHKYTHIWKNVCTVDKYAFAKYGEIIPECIGDGFPPNDVFNRIIQVYDERKNR